MDFNLNVWKYPDEGFLQTTYSPLRNYKNVEGNIVDFNVNSSELNISATNILMECQPSYDGTVNLIINDDKNPPRIINTRFTRKENNSFKVINRNQLKQSNIYEENKLDKQTRLINNTNFFPKIDLLGVNYGGQLKGGNYTIYLKYIDSDFNESPIVCESGQISVFHGSNPSECSGALSNELTNKSIRLWIRSLDSSYNSFKLYLVRNYSDTDGTRFTEAFVISEPYTFSSDNISITITGYESIESISVEDINIRYQSILSAKTQAQVQNMLFFGNIEKSIANYSELQNLAYYVEVTLKQSRTTIGYVDNTYDYKVDTEYYNPVNTYYKLGYWPGEYYRMGIVYIMNDDTLSPVFNLRGCSFIDVHDDNKTITENKGTRNSYVAWKPYSKNSDPLEKNTYLTHNQYKINTFGVFKFPDEKEESRIIGNEEVKPWYLEMKFSEDVSKRLQELGVKAYFFVRQKRIPTIFGQGVSFGIDKTSYAPMIPMSNNYLAEGFLRKGAKDGEITDFPYLKRKDDVSFISINPTQVQSSCLISVDVDTSPSTQSALDGSTFCIEQVYSGQISSNKRSFSLNIKEIKNNTWYWPAVYVAEETPYKFVGDYGFSTKFGSAEEVKSVSFIGKEVTNTKADEGGTTEQKRIYESDSVYGGRNINILRGIYTGVVGLCGRVSDGCVCNIRIPNYSNQNIEDYFNIRKNDYSTYFAISDRYSVSDYGTKDIYRGDCYTNTVSVRLNRNFVDPDAPIQDNIVDDKTWLKNYLGYLQMGTGLGDKTSDVEYEEDKKVSGDWSKINRSDVNAVPLGTWFTYKCLSSNNLGLRSVDRSYPDEQALMGNPRSFYPLNGRNLFSAGKISDSKVLNLGYGATVGVESHLGVKDLPYQKELFDNRIMFSNIQVEDEFQNGYRVFQNLAYKDIDRQYGAIVKLLPWGTDLLCVFEHGIGIVPVNEKALIQTTTDQSIHMYGAGVLQSQISLITGDYGSVWQESIIRTPIGVYGVDTFAKKIWRYSQHKGFETISDMTVQRFLNDHILIDENSSTPNLALRNVKTHYNNYKGDVIFTFYNDRKKEEWSLCYNERLGKWITRYSWTPLYSENINNIYYSFDKRSAETLSKIARLYSDDYGLKVVDERNLESELPPLIYGNNDIRSKFILSNTELSNTKFKILIRNVYTSYLSETGKNVQIAMSKDNIENVFTVDSSEETSNIIALNNSSLKSWWRNNFKTITEEEVYSKLMNEDGSMFSTTEYTKERVLEIIGEFDEDGIKNEIYEYEGYWCSKAMVEKDNYDNVPIEMPLWLNLDVDVNCFYGEKTENEGYAQSGIYRPYTIVFLVDKKYLSEKSDKEMYDKMFINGVYVHGRAGIFDEIDYTDDSLDNQILPTKWYDKQEPFEFEFVVNDPIGIHKVFENLIIISNNVAPESIQFEIEGDSYSMWKSMNSRSTDKWINPTYNKNSKKEQYQNNTLFKNASVKWDTILNQYSILMTQECKSIEKFGRRLGNMHYKEDAWYITINPLLLLNKDGKVTSSTKLRDKYLKVRVRYSGEDLAVITAIKSMVNLSAS